jgi:hypothetical protein
VFNTIDINEHKCVCINHVKFTMNKKEKSGFTSHFREGKSIDLLVSLRLLVI